MNGGRLLRGFPCGESNCLLTLRPCPAGGSRAHMPSKLVFGVQILTSTCLCQLPPFCTGSAQGSRMQLSKSGITSFSQGTAVHPMLWEQKENVRPPIQSPLCFWLLALWASPTGPRGNEAQRHPLCPHRPSAETSTDRVLAPPCVTAALGLSGVLNTRGAVVGPIYIHFWERKELISGDEKPCSPHLGSALCCPLAWQPAVTAGSAQFVFSLCLSLHPYHLPPYSVWGVVCCYV